MAQTEPRKPRGKAARYGIPAGVAGIAALTIGLVPALADTGAPDLPKISAEELVAKMAASETSQMSGTVKVSTDLGLPELPGIAGGSGGQGGGLFGGGPHGDEQDGGKKGSKAPAPEPQEKLMELASGQHTLRVAADGPEKQRVSLVEETSEYSLIHNGDEAWAYDSGSDSALHMKAPEGAGGKHRGHHGGKPDGGLGDVTPQKAAKQALKAAGDTTSVTVDGTAQVAGRDAYQLVIKPKGAPHSTVDSVRIAVDAENGTPLKFTLAPKGGGEAAVDIAYTKVDFGKPDAGTFDFKPPKGTDVTEAGPHGAAKRGADGNGKLSKGEAEKFEKLHKKLEKEQKREGFGPGGFDVLGKGWGSVAKLDMGEEGAGGLPGADSPSSGSGDAKSPEGFLDGFSEKAKGDFGTGRFFHTRLVNALMTDDGKVYVGAVTKEGLIKAADAAAK